MPYGSFQLQNTQLALPVASISVEEVGELLRLLASVGSQLLVHLDALLLELPSDGSDAGAAGREGGQAEHRLLACRLATMGQRVCQFIAATLLKMGSDRGVFPMNHRQLGACLCACVLCMHVGEKRSIVPQIDPFYHRSSV